ncbi:hypothetical protein D9M71_781420 [compost metagenome]
MPPFQLERGFSITFVSDEDAQWAILGKPKLHHVFLKKLNLLFVLGVLDSYVVARDYLNASWVDVPKVAGAEFFNRNLTFLDYIPVPVEHCFLDASRENVHPEV